MSKPKVIISHPGRQHAHQTVYALQETGLLKKYFTSIWYKPDQYPYKLMRFLPHRMEKYFSANLRKRYFEPIDQNLIEQIPFYELTSKFGQLVSSSNQSKFIYWANKKFDEKVSMAIKAIDFDLFIRYETSSLLSFQACKKLGKICVLDLAQAHHSAHSTLDRIGLSAFDGNSHLRKRIERIKQQELELADFILSPSEYSRNSLLDAEIPERKIFKTPYGYDKKLFKPKPFYRKDGTFKILFVGAITKRKGIQYLLQAFKELSLKDAELILVGGMADAVDLLAQNKGLFRYQNFVCHEELAALYQDADLFVLPSLLDSFAIVVLEAMVCGTPVIVSKNTGAKDVVRDGIDGYIVPIMDTEALKEKMLFLYRNRHKVEELGRNASRQAENCTWELYRERIRNIILGVLPTSQGIYA